MRDNLHSGTMKAVGRSHGELRKTKQAYFQADYSERAREHDDTAAVFYSLCLAVCVEEENRGACTFKK